MQPLHGMVKRGWENVDVPKFECEICDAQLDFALPSASSCEAIMEMVIVKKEYTVFLTLPLCKLVTVIYGVFLALPNQYASFYLSGFFKINK